MSDFDEIIGYEAVKAELRQILDMLKRNDKYQSFGAKLPKGVLLRGARGNGKTTMAECFLKECDKYGIKNIPIYKSSDDCDLAEILPKVFEDARAAAPSVIFIDDLDAISGGDFYSVLQFEMEACDDGSVFVLATVADLGPVQESLITFGRFGRIIDICNPSEIDCYKIIRHYLKKIKTDRDINFEDLSAMLSDRSCAEIKAIINDSAADAIYSGQQYVSMENFDKVCLRLEYTGSDFTISMLDNEIKEHALHEAGHIVACEALCPGGVAFASVRTDGRDSLDGFVYMCKERTRRNNIIISLAGKAAVELYYSETCASGCYSDIRKAFRHIREATLESGSCGLGMIDVGMWNIAMSENMNTRNEAVVHAQMENYMFKTKDILLKNREFLEKTTEMLCEKKFLHHSDIRALRESVKFKPYELII